MRLIVTGKQIPLSTALNTYAQTKLSKLDSLTAPSTSIHLTLHAEKYLKGIQARMVNRGTEYHVALFGEDLYAVVDELKRKLSKQLLKAKACADTHAHKRALAGRAFKRANSAASEQI